MNVPVGIQRERCLLQKLVFAADGEDGKNPHRLASSGILVQLNADAGLQNQLFSDIIGKPGIQGLIQAIWTFLDLVQTKDSLQPRAKLWLDFVIKCQLSLPCVRAELLWVVARSLVDFEFEFGFFALGIQESDRVEKEQARSECSDLPVRAIQRLESAFQLYRQLRDPVLCKKAVALIQGVLGRVVREEKG